MCVTGGATRTGGLCVMWGEGWLSCGAGWLM
jgi:hypothetical protein